MYKVNASVTRMSILKGEKLLCTYTVTATGLLNRHIVPENDGFISDVNGWTVWGFFFHHGQYWQNWDYNMFSG